MSPPPYASLDFALLRDPDALRENQARLGAEVGFAPERLYQATQVHGATVLVASGDRRGMEKSEADALVAEPGSGNAVAVRVADCVPVLLADPVTGRVAAVHAGWKGIEAKVIEAAALVLERGSDPSRWVAAIGPCIGACCFEVGTDVADRIVRASSRAVVASTLDDKVYIDLRRAARGQLIDLGVSDDAIDDVPSAEKRVGCTRCDAARFYSYRRDGDASGRLMGVIVARGGA